jgi:hypothetical protein
MPRATVRPESRSLSRDDSYKPDFTLREKRSPAAASTCSPDGRRKVQEHGEKEDHDGQENERSERKLPSSAPLRLEGRLLKPP